MNDKMKKIGLILILIAIFCVNSFAGKVPVQQAIDMGINAFHQRVLSSSIEVKNIDYCVEAGDTLMVVLNFAEGGFLIIGTEDAFEPVLAYSPDGDFNLRNMAPGARFWLDNYAGILSQLRKSGASADESVAAKWNELQRPDSKGTRSIVVSPLLASKWNQSQYYNDLCPADEDSPVGYGGHVPCGCVALAMASIIHYFRYPETSQGGTHGYYSNYGYLSVNYSNQHYSYDAMPYSLIKANNEVAKLIYHCGVAVDMSYYPDGSGAQSSDARDVLKNNYKYSSDIQAVNRSGWWGGGYSNSEWIALLKEDLDNHYPILYSGYNDEGGHAFVCDGYDSDNLFHFNFGWGGTNNGYFTVNSNDENNAGGFGSGQDIVCHIHPPLNSYPTFCSSTTINASAGSLEDGSGPLDYQNNANCTYIIRPENGKSVTIQLDALDLEENHDFLKIWNGDPNDGGTLVATYTGTSFNPTESHYVAGPAAYITFTTDGAGTAAGWKLHFNARRYVSCQSSHNFVAKTGEFEDGSGEETYAADANCSWNIKPANASYILLHFTNFDLSPEDEVTIYDGLNTSTANVLATYTGSTLPANVASYTGTMKVAFKSDNYIERAGFAATWTSDGDEPTDIESYTASSDVDFDVYPNPATNRVMFTIPAQFQNATLRLSDLSGRLIRNIVGVQADRRCEMNVSDLPNGVYLITLSNSQNIISKKLVINK